MYNTYRTLHPRQGFIGSQDQGSLMEGLAQTQMQHHHTRAARSHASPHNCAPRIHPHANTATGQNAIGPRIGWLLSHRWDYSSPMKASRS